MYARSNLGSDGNANYFLLVEVTDGYSGSLGNKKNADVMP